jgi:carboxyl-terminal processing protease
LLLLVVFACVGASGNAGETGHDNDKRGHGAPRQPPPATETEEEEEDDPYELQRVLVDTLDQVQRNYVKGISRRELVEAAIEGILRKLDPYSAYIGPDQLEQFRRSVENEFGGIGVRIGMDGGRLKVISPLVGTPAYRAGVLSGDRIIQIDGRGTAGISLDEAVQRLKGKVGSTVTLTVIHPGAGRGEKEKITVTRDQIRVETVLGDRHKDDDAWDFMLEREKRIGYVRITGFSHNTAKELRAALESLRKEKLRALILDLRFNPGGLLRSAIEVSDMFISKGRIVSTTGRNSPERTWDAHDKDTFDDFPMVVLVNRYTASAGEIVAACLQDHRRAVVMGERTWGKGSVQNVISLEHGRSRLKLTTAEYRRPSGKNIHRFPDAKDADPWGVKPDEGYELRLDIMEMLALINGRRGRDIVHAMEPKEAAEKKVAAKEVADRLLEMAVEYLADKPAVR